MPKNVIFSLLCEQHCFMCDFYLHNICRGHFTVELISHLHLHKACIPGFLVLLLIPINAFHLSGRQVCYLRSCCSCSLPLFAAFLWASYYTASTLWDWRSVYVWRRAREEGILQGWSAHYVVRANVGKFWSECRQRETWNTGYIRGNN